jgi:hypothetical protein
MTPIISLKTLQSRKEFFGVCLSLVLALLMSGCDSTNSKSSDENEETTASCTEPENPYNEGSGHYAGFEWAERNASAGCNGSSQSFNEGCEEYEHQEATFEDGEARKKR